MDQNLITLPDVPEFRKQIVPGTRVRIGRFNTAIWEVGYGWFKFSGNREICGWYVTNVDTGDVRPLQRIDLVDIYYIE